MKSDRIKFWIVPIVLLLAGLAGGLEINSEEKRATTEAERAANLQRVADTAILKARMKSRE